MDRDMKRQDDASAIVVFWPREKCQWWYTSRFGHVSILFFNQHTWIHQDLQRHGLVVDCRFEHDDVNEMLADIMRVATLVRAPVKVRSHFFAPMTCVSFVKHAMGIKSRALRPDTLFNHLMREPETQVVHENPKAVKK